MASAAPLHQFSYDVAPNPWNDVPSFTPYPPADNLSITNAVLNINSVQCVLVPVLKDYGSYYYVAVMRGGDARQDNVANLVQFRVDFDTTGKHTVRERSVSVSDSIKLLHPRFEFESTRLSTSDVTKLFWDTLRVESLRRCDTLTTKTTPLHTPFLIDAFYYNARNSFTTAVFDFRILECYEANGFRMTLSTVLLEACVCPTKAFVQLIPYDDGFVESRINHRHYVGVVRKAASHEINVVHFDGVMRQSKVVFFVSVQPGIPARPVVSITALAQLPGFTLTSSRFGAEEKDALMQTPVRSFWGRSANRIMQVGSSSGIPTDQVFQFEQRGLAGMAPYDAYFCSQIRDAVAHVCISGGPTDVLVPLNLVMPTPGVSMPFFLIQRSGRDVTVQHMLMFKLGFDAHGWQARLPAAFTDTLPHMRFVYGHGRIDELNCPVISAVVRSVWTKRVDKLLLVDHPPIATTKLEFRVMTDTNIITLNTIAAERLERVLRLMCSDPAVDSTLVPLPEYGPGFYAAVVRWGLVRNVSLGAIWNGSLREITPIRCEDFQAPNFVPMLFARGHHMAIGLDILRVLFEEPIFTHWQQEAAINPHTWTPRAEVIGQAMHLRLGGESPMRVIKEEIARMLAELSI